MEGVVWLPLESLVNGVPGAGGGLQTSMVVLSGGVTFSTRRTGNGRKPNVGHLSPCDSE